MIEVTAGGPVGEGAEAALLVGAGSDGTFDAAAGWVLEQIPWIGDRLETDEFTGKPGQVASFACGSEVPYDTVVFVGLGDDPDPDTVRRAAGAAARSLTKAETVATSLHGACEGGAGAAAFGLVLGGYRFDRHKSQPSTKVATKDPAATMNTAFLRPV